MKRLITFAFLSAYLTSTIYAANPEFNLILPRGAQVGTEVLLDLHGKRLEDAEELVPYTPEIKVLELKVNKPDNASAKIKIEPNCRLGQHMFRIRTKSGLTYARTFWVGSYATVEEKEPNTSFDQAQEVPLNSTVTGTTEQEDVDYFKVQAKKGERITVELEGIRLGMINMDPYVGILNSKKFELATCDDSALHLQDPHASYIVPEDGTYYIEARDSSYVGNGNYRYRLHIGSFPRPTAVFPPGGKAGTELEVAFLGDAGGELKTKVTIPNTPGEKLDLFATKNGQISQSPNPFRISQLENYLEVEPNNSHAEAQKQSAIPELPIAINGIISQNGDEDWIQFKAKKDQKVDLQLHARSLRSPLDGVVEIFNAQGGGIGGSDDNGPNPDGKIAAWTCPADGIYFARVRDHLQRGGPDFIYRLEASPAAPSLMAAVVRQDRIDTQLRTQMIVPKGNTICTVVNVERANLGGDVIWENSELPAGVKMDFVPLPANLGQYVIAFTAAADAPNAVRYTQIKPKLADEKNPFVGKWNHGIEWVQGEPNNTPYYVNYLPTLPVCVVDEVPFSLEIVKPTVPAVQSGNIDLTVMAKRKEGFTKPINVRMLWNPPGISSTGQVTIPEGQSQVVYQLNVGGGAETKTWKIAVTGESDAGQGLITASSPLQDLTVAPPYLTMKIEMGAVEQGKSGELLCKLEHAKAFVGKAKLTLFGLPAKAVTTEKEIAAGETEVRFPVTAAPDTPAGKHQNLFVNCVLLENGVPVPHIIGQGGVIRVDPPPPAPPPAKMEQPVAQAAPAPAPAAPAAAKPLSRLEQLRQQQTGK
jgi:hypothetical protein